MRPVDIDKVRKIISVLGSHDWMCIKDISEKTGINESTVRLYVNTHLHNFIESTPTRGRFIRMKSQYHNDIQGVLNAMKSKKLQEN